MFNSWFPPQKILEEARRRKKRKEELKGLVRKKFPRHSGNAFVVALAGDRKVEWRPDFIKTNPEYGEEMGFECYDIASGEPVSTTVWWTYNGSKSKGDIVGSSGTLKFKAKFLIFTWKVKAWGNKSKDIVIFYY